MKLLIAVDLHDRPDEVVTQAATWASRLASRADILYANEFVSSLPYVRDPVLRAAVEEEWEALEAQDEERLQRLLILLPGDVRGSAEIVKGHPADVIAQRSDDYDAVLVGTHQRHGLSRVWLGSVAERIARYAHCPVVFLRLIPPEPPATP